MWSSDYWKLLMMTPDEVNGHTDAADVDVRSIMKLDAVDTEVGIALLLLRRITWLVSFRQLLLLLMTTYEVNDEAGCC